MYLLTKQERESRKETLGSKKQAAWRRREAKGSALVGYRTTVGTPNTGVQKGDRKMTLH